MKKGETRESKTIAYELDLQQGHNITLDSTIIALPQNFKKRENSYLYRYDSTAIRYGIVA